MCARSGRTCPPAPACVTRSQSAARPGRVQIRPHDLGCGDRAAVRSTYEHRRCDPSVPTYRREMGFLDTAMLTARDGEASVLAGPLLFFTTVRLCDSAPATDHAIRAAQRVLTRLD